jgi:hypothetical protein
MSNLIEELSEASINDDPSLIDQLQRVGNESQQLFVMTPTEYGNQFDGYAKFDGIIVRHGPSFFVGELDPHDKAPTVSSYIFYSRGRDLGGLEEKIFSNRTEYTLNGEYTGQLGDKDGLIWKLFERIKCEFSHKVAWALELPVYPNEPNAAIFDGGDVAKYRYIRL